MVEIFNFVHVIILTVLFLMIFAFLSPVVNDSVDNWKAQSWASEKPLLTFFISGVNFWIFLGMMFGILGAIVYGTQVWWSGG